MRKVYSDLSMRWCVTKGAIGIWAASPDRKRRRRAAASYLGDSAHDDAVGALRVDGFVPWSLSKASLRDLLSAYRQAKESRANGEGEVVERHTAKLFFGPDLSRKDLQTYPAFLDVALEHELLRVLTKTAGLVPHLEDVEVMVSNPVSGNLSASQLWHRDVNDKVILKLFIYLNDVGPENGPFTFMRATASSGIPSYGPHYKDDKTVLRFTGRDAWQRVEGPVGTSFLIDTHNCLHCGSRCQKPRTAYIATYSSGLKFMHRSREWRAILGERIGGLDDLQKRVLGLVS